MKWGVLGVVIAGLAAGVFLYVQPRMTLRSLAEAIEDGDAEGIKDHVDFESVRRDLKDEFIAKMDLSSEDDENSGATAFATAIAGKAVEAMVEGMLSPEVLAQSGGGQIEITDAEYKTASRFHANVQRAEAQAPLTLVLRRAGMDWRVTAIKPPEVTWREFEGYRRQLTAEAGANLKAIFTNLKARHEALTPGEAKEITISRTPDEIPCGEPYTWTEEDRAKWEVIGFAPSEPTNYSYSIEKTENPYVEVSMRAVAVGDLDCDGDTSLFGLEMGENNDGDLYRAPGIYVEQMLE